MFSNREKQPYIDNKLQVHQYSTRKYPFRLNFYDIPPLYDVTLSEFEEAAIHRLRVLFELESSLARNRPWEETKAHCMTHCRKWLPLGNNTAISVDLEAERRKDHLSHFVLRLAFCGSEELRRRFTKAELLLFKIRYDTDDTREREAFLNSRNFHWTIVSRAEKEENDGFLLKQLSTMATSQQARVDQNAILEETYCKVKWTRVPDLVEKRRVFLHKGMAYVPYREQSSIVFQEFEEQLVKALELTAKSLPRLDEDSRLVPILKNLAEGFLSGVPSDWTPSTAGSSEVIRAEMIDDFARQHFPLCMKINHENLRRNKRLDHAGRLQYGLFLKVLGLSLEEALVFWRKSFSRHSDDEYNKKGYVYNIRHSYGQEGKRTNYPAHSCMHIINKTEAAYGCPYRHFTPENLSTALTTAYPEVTSSDLPEIMHLVKGEHYHLACTRVYEIVHKMKKGQGVGEGECITHPNEWFVKSREETEKRNKQAMEVE